MMEQDPDSFANLHSFPVFGAYVKVAQLSFGASTISED